MQSFALAGLWAQSMKRFLIGGFLVVCLSAPAAAQPGTPDVDGPSSQALNHGADLANDGAADLNADSHRFDLQVHYLSYSRHDEWHRLKAAGLTDLEAVHFLLANPRGTALASPVMQ